jgi:regulator of sirC expression with transglutaminase-like and TPR domain
MLPRVLARRRGLPITLSVLYVGVARRVGIPLQGVGLPGHFVAGHFVAPGARPELLDPFHNGVRIAVPDLPEELLRPWGPHETALRMINNLVGSFTKRGNVAHAIHAADLRLLLPVEPSDMERLTLEARALRARLN